MSAGLAFISFVPPSLKINKRSSLPRDRRRAPRCDAELKRKRPQTRNRLRRAVVANAGWGEGGVGCCGRYPPPFPSHLIKSKCLNKWRGRLQNTHKTGWAWGSLVSPSQGRVSRHRWLLHPDPPPPPAAYVTGPPGNMKGDTGSWGPTFYPARPCCPL